MQINEMGQHGMMQGQMPPIDQSGGHRPPPPPGGEKGDHPLKPLMDTLSVDEREGLKSTLDSFSQEQRAILKQKLDELKPQSTSMTKEEIGTAFMSIIEQIASGQSTLNADGDVDTYG